MEKDFAEIFGRPTENPDTHYSGFACSCDNDDVSRLRYWIEETVGIPSNNYWFIDRIIHQLNRLGAHISGIYTDQWSAISTERTEPKFTTWVECDNILDGLALTLYAYKQRFKDDSDT